MERSLKKESARRLIIATAIVSVCLAGYMPIRAHAKDAPQDPAGVLTLDRVVELVRTSNPDLLSASWNVRAAKARAKYGGRWKNPSVSVQVEDVFGTKSFRGFSQAQATLEVGQVFELGRKAKKRRARFRDAEGFSKRGFEEQSLIVLGEAALRFAHVLADQKRLELAIESLELSRRALVAARKRVKMGAASIIEERRATVVLARGHIEEEHAEHELLASRYRLAALWGSTQPKFTVAVGDLFERKGIPVFEELKDRVADSAELKRIVSGRKLANADAHLQKANALPNLRVTAGARWLMGADAMAFVASATLPLPIVDRNRASIAASKAMQQRSLSVEYAARVRIETKLFTQYQEVSHLLAALDMLEKEVLPQALATLETIESAFRRGRSSQLELVDAHKTLLEVRNEHIDTAEEYQRYVVLLHRLIGRAPFLTVTEEGEKP